MKTRTLISAISILIVLVLFMLGCQLSATIVMEDVYDVRIVNRSGETVKVRLDDTSYYYLEDGDYFVLSSVDGGYHEIEWESASMRSRRNTRPSQTFSLEIDASIEIVIRDGSDLIIIDL